MERLTVTHGLHGYFAVLYDTETKEAIQTGFDSHDNILDAYRDTVSWGQAEDIPIERLDYILGGGH